MESNKTALPQLDSIDDIKGKIYTIRGVQVMLDSDLAELYQVETKRINETVRRNPKRFPKRYCFELTKEEYDGFGLKSQNATSKGRGGRRSSVKVFTEQGVAMLSSVLTSDIAVNVSLRIMDAFVEIRHYLADNAIVFHRLEKLEEYRWEADRNFKAIFRQLEEPRQKKAVLFFRGQMFDAFSCIADVIRTAEKEIILIDGYTDTATLDLLSKKREGVAVFIYTGEKHSKLTESEIDSFNREYPSLAVKYTTEFHDRFLIIDRKTLFHSGASLKDAGKKAFEISEIDDEKQMEEILRRL